MATSAGHVVTTAILLDLPSALRAALDGAARRHVGAKCCSLLVQDWPLVLAKEAHDAVEALVPDAHTARLPAINLQSSWIELVLLQLVPALQLFLQGYGSRANEECKLV